MRRKLFNRLCEIQARSLSRDAATGENAESWSVLASAVPCRLRENFKTRVERKQGRLRYRRSGYALYMDWRELDPAEHRIAIAGKIYEVTGLENLGGERKLLCLYLETVR